MMLNRVRPIAWACLVLALAALSNRPWMLFATGIAVLIFAVLMVAGLLGLLSERTRQGVALICLLLAIRALAQTVLDSTSAFVVFGATMYSLAVILWFRPRRVFGSHPQVNL